MIKIHKTLIKLATVLVKYYAEKTMGLEAQTIIVKSLADAVGENAIEKISSFLDQGAQFERLLEVFKTADECFAENIDDHSLSQAIISMPLAGLDQLELLAKQISSNLDDQGLLTAIRDRFEMDWPNKFSKEQLDRASIEYRDCLDKALATKLDQMLPTIFRKIDRIEHASRRLSEGQFGINTEIKRFDETLSNQNDAILQLA